MERNSGGATLEANLDFSSSTTLWVNQERVTGKTTSDGDKLDLELERGGAL